MYQKVLIDQWKNLYSDFAEEYELLQSQGDAVTAFNRWYEARVHRWSSVAYSEGIILEQENKPDFSEELQHVIKKFQFNKVEADGETSLWMGTVAGVALGTLGAGILAFLQWNWIRIIVGGIMLFIFTEALFLKKNTDHKKQEQKRVKEEYMQQLKKYQDELTAVCEKYQVE